MTTNQGDVIRVSTLLTYGVAGQAMQNVLHLKASDAVAVTDAQTLVDMGLAMEQLYQYMHTVQHTSIQYISYTAQNITQALLLGTSGWPTFVAGLDPGVPASPQVVGLVLARTIKPRVQGRMSMMGLREGSITNGLMDGLLLTALVNQAAEILLPLLGAIQRYQYVVYNRTLGTDIAPNSSAVIVPTRTQRRRSTGFGV